MQEHSRYGGVYGTMLKAAKVPAFLFTAILLAGTGACGRRPIAPATAASHVELFRQGVAAFDEATPEGYRRAAAAFRQARSLDSSRCEYPLYLSQALFFLGEEQQMNYEDPSLSRAEAQAVLQAAKSTCTGPEAFILRLEGALLGRTAEAIAKLRRATELDPDDPMNWYLYSKAEPVNYAANLQRAADRGANKALYLYTLGDYQSSRGAKDTPQELLRRAIEWSPRHFKSYLALAYATTRADEDAEVEPLYRKVVEIAPEFLEGRLAMGHFFESVDDVDGAIGEYESAARSNPSYDVAHFAMGLLMLRLERYAEAEQAFHRVVELNPSQGEAFYYLGFLALARSDTGSAKDFLVSATKLRPNYGLAEFRFGQALQLEGDFDAALAQYDRAIRMAPDLADAYVSRASLPRDRRPRTAALRDLDLAVDLFDRQIELLDEAILAAESRPDSRAAQASLRRSQRAKSHTEASRQHASLQQLALEDGATARPLQGGDQQAPRPLNPAPSEIDPERRFDAARPRSRSTIRGASSMHPAFTEKNR